MKKGEETKSCGACHKDLTTASYSKKQWQNKTQRRCKECIESDIPIEKIDLNNDYCKDDNKEKGCVGSKDKHSKKVKGKGGRDNENRGRPFNMVQHDVNAARSVVNEMSATATTSTQPAAPLPPPTLEQVSQMKKIMSDPKQLAKMMNDRSGYEAVLRGNPDYAKSIASNPLLQHQPNMNEEDIKKMAEIVNNMSDDAVRAMLACSDDYTVADDKKVSIQPARKITNEAACWVCLDGGADDDGNPLVRDCSCRGNMG